MSKGHAQAFVRCRTGCSQHDHARQVTSRHPCTSPGATAVMSLIQLCLVFKD